jgi:hypothetical protein
MPEMRHPTVSIEYAGKWIAWDHDMTRIVASGTSLDEVIKAAKDTGESDPVFAKAPPAHVRLIGMGSR